MASDGVGNSGIYGIKPSSLCSGVITKGRRGSIKLQGSSKTPPFPKPTKKGTIKPDTS